MTDYVDTNPPGRPQKYNSGPVERINFCAPPGMRARIARAAVEEGRNNSDWLVGVVEAALKSGDVNVS